MVNYDCQRCGYSTHHKSVFKKHLLRKNLCNPEFEEIDRYNLLLLNKFVKEAEKYKQVNKCKPIVTRDVSPNIHFCIHCGKEFKSRKENINIQNIIVKLKKKKWTKIL